MPQNKSPFTIGTPQPEPQSIQTPMPTQEPQPVRRQSPFTIAPEGAGLGSIVREIPVVGPTIADFGAKAAQYVAPYAEPVVSKLAPIFDILSRGQYASAAFFDSNMDDSKNLFDSVSAAFNELLPAKYAIEPQMKLSFSDVFKRRDPTFAKENPKTTAILGFLGDVALDPTSYLGVGLSKSGIKLSGEVLTKEGEQLLTRAITKGSKTVFQGGDNTLGLIDMLAAESRRPVREFKRTGTIEDRLAKYDTTIKNQYKQEVQAINDKVFTLPEQPSIKVREASQPSFGKDLELSATAETPVKPYSLDGPSSERRHLRVFWDNAPEGVKVTSPIHQGQRENVLFDMMTEGRTTTQGDTAMFLSELQNDWVQKFKGVGLPPDVKKNWLSYGLDYAIQEAKAKGFDGILLPKTAEQINDIQKWGGITEKDGKWFNTGGQNITPVIKRYTQEIPEIVRKKLPEVPATKTAIAEEAKPSVSWNKDNQGNFGATIGDKEVSAFPYGKGQYEVFIGEDRLGVYATEEAAKDAAEKAVKADTKITTKLDSSDLPEGYTVSKDKHQAYGRDVYWVRDSAGKEVASGLDSPASAVTMFRRLQSGAVDEDRAIYNNFTVDPPRAKSLAGTVEQGAKETATTTKGANQLETRFIQGGKGLEELWYLPIGEATAENKAALAAADVAAQSSKGSVNPIDALRKIKAQEAEFNAAKAADVAQVDQRYADLLDRNTNKFYGGPRQHIVAPLVNELANQGYFQVVKQRVNAFNDIIKQVKGTTRGNNILATKLAKAEVFKDLNLVDTTKLGAEEFRERIEKRILDVINVLPPTTPVFAKNGVYLKASLPFGQQKDLFRIVGTDKIGSTIKLLNNSLISAGKFGKLVGKIEDTLGGAFNRDYGLPQEYITLRNGVENHLGEASSATVRDALEVRGKMTQASKDKLGKTMQEIDDTTRILEKQLGRDLTEEEASKLVTDGLRANRLNATEKAAAAILYQDYKDMALAEMRAGLLNHNLVNYSPRGYNAILDPGDMTTISRGKFREAGGPNPYLSSSQERKYLTNAEAKAAGLDLETDAIVLYANRLLAHRRAMGIKQFKDSVTEMFGTYTSNAKYAHTGNLPTGVLAPSDIPKRVIDDMRMIGEAVVPSGMSDTGRNLIKFARFLNLPFKKAATIARPTFAMRQLVSNTNQAAMISGIKAFKAFDPRAAMDAFFLTFRNNKTKQLPDFISSFINKTFSGSDAVLAERTIMSSIAGEEHLMDFANHWHMTNPFGEKITGVEMVDELRNNGVIRGFDATGETFSKQLTQELDRTFSNKSVAFELSKYWKHAQLVEDYNRVMLYVNGRRLGHSPTEAAGLVNKALFDYSRGLSSTEKILMKTLVPFYSFQRFAIPYVIKQTLKQPGNFATTQKFVNTLEKLISSGESLNPSEREAIPGYLLEQPTLYGGFDKDGKAVFNLLNNLTPYDVMNLMVLKKDGSIDYGRTVEKSVLGAVAPFLKVPAEMYWNYNLFTGKTMEQATNLGDLSGSLKKVIPEKVRELIQWEDKTDPRTGKMQSFINPYLAYSAMNYFPILRDYIKPLDATTKPMDMVINIMIENMNPVKQGKVDLRAAAEYDTLKSYNEIQDTVKQLKYAQLKGSKVDTEGSKADRLQKQIQEMIKVFGENNQRKSQYEVRGQGIGGVPTDPEVQKQTLDPTTPITQQFK